MRKIGFLQERKEVFSEGFVVFGMLRSHGFYESVFEVKAHLKPLTVIVIGRRFVPIHPLNKFVLFDQFGKGFPIDDLVRNGGIDGVLALWEELAAVGADAHLEVVLAYGGSREHHFVAVVAGLALLDEVHHDEVEGAGHAQVLFPLQGSFVHPLAVRTEEFVHLIGESRVTLGPLVHAMCINGLTVVITDRERETATITDILVVFVETVVALHVMLGAERFEGLNEVHSGCVGQLAVVMMLHVLYGNGGFPVGYVHAVTMRVTANCAIIMITESRDMRRVLFPALPRAGA